MAKIYFNPHSEWDLEDYKALYDLALELSFVSEGLPRIANDKSNAQSINAKQCLSVLAEIIEVLNDAPKTQVESARKDGNILPFPCDEF